jgi:hypothetical protein
MILFVEEVQLKNIISSSTTNTSMETKESSSGAAKEASAPKDATKDTKMHSSTGQESAKGDGKNKEKSKSPAKDLPAASSGSSPEKQVAKSATGADIKTNDKNAKPASPEKSKAAPVRSKISKFFGIIQSIWRWKNWSVPLSYFYQLRCTLKRTFRQGNWLHEILLFAI